jgi:hypothetical protein
MSAFERVTRQIGEALESEHKKIGGMHAGGMARLGLAELRQAASMEGSVADHTQSPYGLYGTITPGEVTAARSEEGTAHGPAEAEKTVGAERDPVTAARQSAAAQATRDREPDKGVG